jgi:hypothetical protein
MCYQICNSHTARCEIYYGLYHMPNFLRLSIIQNLIDKIMIKIVYAVYRNFYGRL